jgi:hypothetical protein
LHHLFSSSISYFHPPSSTKYLFLLGKVVEDGGGWKEDLAFVVEDAFWQWRAHMAIPVV